MKQLIINKTKIYTIDDTEYFSFQYKNSIQRDINVKLEKNNKYILEMIAEICELKWKGLNKKQLVELIEKSGCIVLNNDA